MAIIIIVVVLSAIASFFNLLDSLQPYGLYFSAVIAAAATYRYMSLLLEQKRQEPADPPEDAPEKDAGRNENKKEA